MRPDGYFIVRVKSGAIKKFDRFPWAAREGQRPNAKYLQVRVLLHPVLWHSVEPARDQSHASLAQQTLRMLSEQFLRAHEVAAFYSVVDGWHSSIVRLIPIRGGAM